MKNWLSFFLFLGAALMASPLKDSHQENRSTVFDPAWEAWTDEQIRQDFAPYRDKGISLLDLEKTIAWDWKWPPTYPKSSAGAIRLRVVNSRIFMQRSRDPWGCLPSAVYVLEEILKRYPLPDVDFIYIDDDGPAENPLVDQAGETPPGPLLASVKAPLHHNVIRYHDWVTLNQYWPKEHGALDMYLWSRVVENEVEPGHLLHPWEMRENKLFWRGRATGTVPNDRFLEHPRIKLVCLAEIAPHLIDAGLTGWWENSFLKKSLEEDWAPYSKPILQSPVRIQDHLGYKYQLVLDGSIATFPGFAWRLLSNSLTFKVESSLEQWFEGGLIPGEHYIPVKRDLSDLVEKILWAQQYDEEARKIAEKGREFILNQAMEEHVLRYCYKVLLRYAALQRFQPVEPDPEKEPGFIFVSAPLEQLVHMD